ncbi:MAG: hypothetical protein DI539_29310 [Flavobacterium psychrophilum]|nr:MAG: hypothetical protein DI539_29310 [Flavobacterium psychrophilum]
MKIKTAFLIVILSFLSCKSKKAINTEVAKVKPAPTEVNYIPYFLAAEKAKKLYDNKEYEQAYNLLDSLFDTYGVRNTFLINEYNIFFDLSARLNKTHNLENIEIYVYSKLGLDPRFYEENARDYVLKNSSLDSLEITRLKKMYANGLMPVLQDTLKSMIERDQKVRMDGYDVDAFENVSFINDRQLIDIIKANGFPTVQQIDETTVFSGILAMLMHLKPTEKLELQPILFQEVKKGTCPPFIYALMLDKETMINNNDIGFPYYGTVDNRIPADTTACNNARETIGLPRIRFAKQ